jgi:hypothetical protein
MKRRVPVVVPRVRLRAPRRAVLQHPAGLLRHTRTTRPAWRRHGPAAVRRRPPGRREAPARPRAQGRVARLTAACLITRRSCASHAAPSLRVALLRGKDPPPHRQLPRFRPVRAPRRGTPSAIAPVCAGVVGTPFWVITRCRRLGGRAPPRFACQRCRGSPYPLHRASIFLARVSGRSI